jgi:hypothetical protein
MELKVLGQWLKEDVDRAVREEAFRENVGLAEAEGNCAQRVGVCQTAGSQESGPWAPWALKSPGAWLTKVEELRMGI